jgi:phosphatidyl-myo-inositol alpha-mannosyltransferase
VSLRVGVFHSSLPEAGVKPGGVDIYVHRLASRLSERGHAVRVISYSPRPNGAPYDFEQLRPRWLATSTIGRMTAAPLLLNGLETNDLDVLHLHGDDWLYVRRSVPTVRTFHGSALAEMRYATRWRRRLRQAATVPLEAVAGRLATCAYGVAPGYDRLNSTKGWLSCGTDVRATSVEREGPPTVLFVGTLDGRKRGRLLLSVFLKQVLPQVSDARLWMVTDRPVEGPGVTWFDAPDDDELASLYRRAWAFCLPSSYEGFGIPYLEAISLGTPVVATANPGARHVLGSSGGLIVNVEDLGDALVRLLSDGPLRRRVARLGLARATQFSWDRVLEAHERAYCSAIHAWSRRQAEGHILRNSR